MKKIIFILFSFLMAGVAHAQHCDSINDHVIEGYSLEPVFVIQLPDGNLLARVWQDTVISYAQSAPSLVKFYKISRHGLDFLDSVTYDNPEQNDIMMARIHDDGNPLYARYSNVLAKFIVNHENSNTELNLCFFDDDAIFNNDMDVTVTLADTIIDIWPYVGSGFLDSNNDIILQYNIPSRNNVYFDRFGLDGTLKHRTVIPRSILPVYTLYDPSGFFIYGLRQYQESPARYMMYGSYDDQPASFNFQQRDFVGYEFDSLFNIVNQFNIGPTNSSVYPYIHNTRFRTVMTVLDDGSFLLVRDVRWSSDQQGTGIAKYDSTGNLLKIVWFDSTVVPVVNGTTWDDYDGIDLQKDGQGHIYVAFHCVVDSVENVVISKLNEELNIIWVRYGMHVKRPVDFHRYACWQFGGMKLLDHGGVVVYGYNYGRKVNNNLGVEMPHGLFMMLVDDDMTGNQETADGFRPYLFYPNPVKNNLVIHYSPDVTPQQVELYDLQGRPVRTQCSNLENINMEDLPSSSYSLRIIMEDGTTYADKVVKQ